MTPRSLRRPRTSADSDGEARLLAFDRAWQAGTPRIEDYWRPGEASSSSLLQEFITIDLEYRWRHGRGAEGLPARPLLEDYAARYPALGQPSAWPTALVAEETRRRVERCDAHRGHLLARFDGARRRLTPQGSDGTTNGGRAGSRGIGGRAPSRGGSCCDEWC